MDRDQAVRIMHDLLRVLVRRGGSDLFITAGFPPAIKIDGAMNPVAEKPFIAEHTATIARAIMNDRQAREFESTNECNFAIAPRGIGRFRVSALVQQGKVALVLRTIKTEIPDFDSLALPEVLKEVVMSKRGLAIMVIATRMPKGTSSPSRIQSNSCIRT